MTIFYCFKQPVHSAAMGVLRGEAKRAFVLLEIEIKGPKISRNPEISSLMQIN